MDKTQIADRMKDNYEKRGRSYLTRRTPVIMRLDGKAFHTFTRGMKRPFDESLNNMMRATAMKLCHEIQGAKCAYVQSDEISILITDYDKLTTDAWFGYGVQKMCSVSASIATAEFNSAMFSEWCDHSAGDFEIDTYKETVDSMLSFMKNKKTAYFDSRVFNIPREEVNNYFVWRQIDWVRNSIQLAGQSVFSHKQLHCKNTTQIKQMLWDEKGITWEEYEDKWKNGSLYIHDGVGWRYLETCPQFSKQPDVINKLVNCDKDE